MAEKKEFNLKAFAKRLKKQYNSMNVASQDNEPKEYISTKNKALDLALCGGISFGYVAEWAGFSQTGKTTLMQLLLADAQEKYGAIGIWLDRENAWDNDRAESLGVDLDNTIILKPVDIPTVTSATIALKAILKDIPEDKYVFIVIDSLSSFKKEGKDDKSDMGKKAQEFHNIFRDVLTLMNDRMSFHFSNHRTYKIGVMFGDNTTTVGGEGPKFYTTYRIQLEDRKQIINNKSKEILGNWIKATVIKTRKGPGYRSVFFPHKYKSGIDYYGGYGRLLVNRGYLKPKNKTDFKSFKQVTVIHEIDEENKKEFSEFEIEKFLEEYPQFNFDEYPEFNEGGFDDEDDGEES